MRANLQNPNTMLCPHRQLSSVNVYEFRSISFSKTLKTYQPFPQRCRLYWRSTQARRPVQDLCEGGRQGDKPKDKGRHEGKPRVSLNGGLVANICTMASVHDSDVMDASSSLRVKLRLVETLESIFRSSRWPISSRCLVSMDSWICPALLRIVISE